MAAGKRHSVYKLAPVNLDQDKIQGTAYRFFLADEETRQVLTNICRDRRIRRRAARQGPSSFSRGQAVGVETAPHRILGEWA